MGKNPTVAFLKVLAITAALAVVAPIAVSASVEEEDPCVLNPDGALCEDLPPESPEWEEYEDAVENDAEFDFEVVIDPILDPTTNLIDITASLAAVDDAMSNDPNLPDFSAEVIAGALDVVEGGYEEINGNGGPEDPPMARATGVCHVTSLHTYKRLKKFGFLPYYSAYNRSGIFSCRGDRPVRCSMQGTNSTGVPPFYVGMGLWNASLGGCAVLETWPKGIGPRPSAGVWSSSMLGASGRTYVTGRTYLIT